MNSINLFDYYDQFLKLKQLHYQKWNIEKYLNLVKNMNVDEDAYLYHWLNYIDIYVKYEKYKIYFINELLKINYYSNWYIDFEEEILTIND